LNSPAKLTTLSITDAVKSYGKVIKQQSLSPSSLKQTQLHLSQMVGQFSIKWRCVGVIKIVLRVIKDDEEFAGIVGLEKAD